MSKDKKRIGFTGTQSGMTQRQKEMLSDWLRPLAGTYFAHGDCKGADAEAHDIAENRGLEIGIFPPDNPAKRAFKVAKHNAKPAPYLERNKAIVRWCDELIACPKERTERIRSGTWATVRYARAAKVPITIIWPNGTVELS